MKNSIGDIISYLEYICQAGLPDEQDCFAIEKLRLKFLASVITKEDFLLLKDLIKKYNYDL